MSFISAKRWWLLPLSWLYGLGVWFRNTLFDTGLLKSTGCDVPVISVGNITVGGTGKTPMTEYLARLLQTKNQVAVLSRGYKRKSRGFVLASESSTVAAIGDEPYQMKRKLPAVVVAVDEKRLRGIEQLIAESKNAPVDVILLDDAFQHRFVYPGMSILLIDYNRQLKNDYLLPAGNLREPATQLKRADILVFTKCPASLKPIDSRILASKYAKGPHQTVFFTCMDYAPLSPSEGIAGTEQVTMQQIRDEKRPVLIVSGIASPEPFIEYIKPFCQSALILNFPDHHTFNQKDVWHIKQAFEPIKQQHGLIITTEKDLVRIKADDRFNDLLPHIYYLPIQLRFLNNEAAQFNKKIEDYVRLDKRNRRLDSTANAQ